MKHWRTVVIVVASVIGFCFATVAVLSVRSMIYDNDYYVLVSCATDESKALIHPFTIQWRWGCEQILYKFRLDSDDVEAINSDAGARVAVEIPDKAERMLNFFLSKGVDINAEERLGGRRSGWTALHLVAGSALVTPEVRLQAVQLLLAHGAKPELLDVWGNTALYMAKRMQAACPTIDFSQVIKLLETVTPANIDAPPPPEQNVNHCLRLG